MEGVAAFSSLLAGPEIDGISLAVSSPNSRPLHYLKGHAVLMMVAWIGLASNGILLARYYRDLWPGRELCRSAIWFTLHRIFMSLVLILTCGGIACIFMYVGGYTSFPASTSNLDKIHPPLGLCVLILAIVNPFMALCRPTPSSPRRYIFNWAHWCVGTIAHVCGVVNVLIGLSLSKASAVVEGWMIWVIAFWVLFHILIEIILQAQRYRLAMYQADETQSLKDDAKMARGASFRKSLLGFYMLVSCLVCLLFIVCVAIY